MWVMPTFFSSSISAEVRHGNPGDNDHTFGAMTFHLSLLLRHLFGTGTPKQALAGAANAYESMLDWLGSAFVEDLVSICRWLRLYPQLSPPGPGSIPAVA